MRQLFHSVGYILFFTLLGFIQTSILDILRGTFSYDDMNYSLAVVLINIIPLLYVFHIYSIFVIVYSFVNLFPSFFNSEFEYVFSSRCIERSLEYLNYGNIMKSIYYVKLSSGWYNKYLINVLSMEIKDKGKILNNIICDLNRDYGKILTVIAIDIRNKRLGFIE